jgi:hypothetical protein
LEHRDVTLPKRQKKKEDDLPPPPVREIPTPFG